MIKKLMPLVLILAGTAYSMEYGKRYLPLASTLETMAELDYDLQHFGMYIFDTTGIDKPEPFIFTSASIIPESDEVSSSEIKLDFDNQTKNKNRKKRTAPHAVPQRKLKREHIEQKEKIPCAYPNCTASFAKYNQLSNQCQTYLVHIYKNHEEISDEIENTISKAKKASTNSEFAIAICPACKKTINAKRDFIKETVIRHYYASSLHNPQGVEEVKKYIEEQLESK